MYSTDAQDRQHQYEVLGRLMAAFFDSGSPGIFEGAKDFDFWYAGDGGWSFDWRGGPHAGEVADYLADLASDDDWTTALRPGDVTIVRRGLDESSGLELSVRSCRVLMRPSETVGRASAVNQLIDRVRAMTQAWPSHQGCTEA